MKISSYQRIDQFARSFVSKLETKKWLVLLFYSCLYLSVTCPLAIRKLLWNDEILTLSISTLPTMGEIWDALLSGAEQTAPLVFFVTRLMVSIFGLGSLSVRIPEIIGFWVMSYCVFLLVSKRSSVLGGLLAVLFAFKHSCSFLQLRGTASCSCPGFCCIGSPQLVVCY
jgi:hypothetical protein